jgi:predicted HAD superfamily Cof-like phosphohydrolase
MATDPKYDHLLLRAEAVRALADLDGARVAPAYKVEIGRPASEAKLTITAYKQPDGGFQPPVHPGTKLYYIADAIFRPHLEAALNGYREVLRGIADGKVFGGAEEWHDGQLQVEKFHRAFEITIGETPAIRDADLRAKLILEEAIETACALVGSRTACGILNKHVDDLHNAGLNDKTDLAEAIDGMCDVLVVVYGTAVACGVNLSPFFDEVMRTNMAKVGGEVRADGKWLKPPGWKPPRIREMLEEVIKRSAK